MVYCSTWIIVFVPQQPSIQSDFEQPSSGVRINVLEDSLAAFAKKLISI